MSIDQNSVKEESAPIKADDCLPPIVGKLKWMTITNLSDLDLALSVLMRFVDFILYKEKKCSTSDIEQLSADDLQHVKKIDLTVVSDLLANKTKLLRTMSDHDLLVLNNHVLSLFKRIGETLIALQKNHPGLMYDTNPCSADDMEWIRYLCERI